MSRGAVMLALCNGVDPSSLPGFDQLTSEEWRLITQDAIYHGIAPALYSRVRDWMPGLIPSACIDTLRDTYLRTAINNSLGFEELRRILALFGEAGIPTIVLKGAYLATAVYPSPAHRPMSDIDLLFPLEGVSQAYALMKNAGYVAEHTGPLDKHLARNRCIKMFGGVRGLQVELHWTLGQHGNLNTGWIRGIWERAVPVRAERLTTMAMSPVDLLVHLCLHAIRDHRCKVPVRSVLDIAYSLRCFRQVLDPAALMQVSAEANGTRVLRCGVLIAQRLFPDASLDAFVRQLGCSEDDEQNADLAAALLMSSIRLTGKHPASTWNALVEADSWRARIRILAQGVAPSAERVRRLHRPDARGMGLTRFYLARPWYLAATHTRYFLKLAFREPGARVEWEVASARRLLAIRVSAPEGRDQISG